MEDNLSPFSSGIYFLFVVRPTIIPFYHPPPLSSQKIFRAFFCTFTHFIPSFSSFFSSYFFPILLIVTFLNIAATAIACGA
jgi:hypothetical protein